MLALLVLKYLLLAATVLEVIQNRSGYDTLLLFVANRIVQGGMDLVKEARTCTPRTVSTLVR